MARQQSDEWNEQLHDVEDDLVRLDAIAEDGWVCLALHHATIKEIRIAKNSDMMKAFYSERCKLNR